MRDIKLDLGCGARKKRGYLGVDKLDLPCVDLKVDLTREKLPFKNSSVSRVYTSHFMEHLTIEEIERLMKEIYRVSRGGAIVEIRVPHYSGSSAYSEYHKTFFRWESFREFLINTNTGMFKHKEGFEMINKRIILPRRPILFWNRILEPLINFWKFPTLYEETFLRNVFPAFEIQFILKVVK